jgi:hypothetical protein
MKPRTQIIGKDVPKDYMEAHAQLVMALGVMPDGKTVAPEIHRMALERAAEGHLAQTIVRMTIDLLYSARTELALNTEESRKRAAQKLADTIGVCEKLTKSKNIVAFEMPESAGESFPLNGGNDSN